MKEKLLKIQQEIGAIKRDSTNPHFKNTYFDINTLLAEVKPILNRHKVVVLQPLGSKDGKLALTTKLIDTESDTEISDTCYVPEDANPQKTGSAITYFRRYALQSLLALEAEDDDGNVASGHKQAPKATVKPQNDAIDVDLPF